MNNIKCQRPATCLFIHDPDKIIPCIEFQKNQSCSRQQQRGGGGDQCLLKHDPELPKDRMPFCVHFATGKCDMGDECIFGHVKIPSSAPVCQDFVQGYCTAGLACTKRHIMWPSTSSSKTQNHHHHDEDDEGKKSSEQQQEETAAKRQRILPKFYQKPGAPPLAPP